MLILFQLQYYIGFGRELLLIFTVVRDVTKNNCHSNFDNKPVTYFPSLIHNAPTTGRNNSS